MEGKRLVLIGGGHAHMMTLASIDRISSRGHSVTVIANSEHHYYSGMGPGMLGGFYSPEQIRFQTRLVVEKQGGEFVLDKAVSVDPIQQRVELETGNSVSYDVLSFNTGSYIPMPNDLSDASNVFTVKPIERLQEAQKQILSLSNQQPVSIAIVGGGPSSIEIAGNIRQLTRTTKHPVSVAIFAGRQLMANFPESIRRRVLNSLKQREITIIEGSYVEGLSNSEITLASGQSHSADLIFLASGVKPSPIFAASGLSVAPDGALPVNRYLQSKQYSNLFGGGDCIYFEPQPLNKVGVYAVRQNPVLLHNLMAALNGSELMPFDPGGDYLLIFNLGDGTGVLKKKWITFGGKLAFTIKDAIDRKFMTKFQKLEVSDS